jgi:hypothetical protein
MPAFAIDLGQSRAAGPRWRTIASTPVDRKSWRLQVSAMLTASRELAPSPHKKNQQLMPKKRARGIDTKA